MTTNSNVDNPDLPNPDLNMDVATLQHRVRLLTAACLASWVVLAALATIVVMQSLRVPEVVRARRVETDAIDAEIVTANTVILQSPDGAGSTLSLGAGKGGAHVALQDAAGNNRVQLNESGLHIGDTDGTHALFLGLNPGPGKLHAPYLQMRDRTSTQRLALGLNGETDAPTLKIFDAARNQTNTIAENSILLDNDDGRIELLNAGTESPRLWLNSNRAGQPGQTTVITPATELSETPEEP